jgi:hypothetical protein
VPLRELVPDLAPHLEQVVARAMEKTPEARFQQIDEMLAAIGDPSGQYATLSGDGEPPGRSWELPAPVPSKSHIDTIGGNLAAEAVRRPAPTRRSGAWLMVVASMVLLAAVGAIAWRARTPSGPTEVGGPVAVIAPRAPEPKPPAAEPKPPAVAPAPAAPSADEAEVRIQVRVQPATAQLFLDGAPIANPFDGRFVRSAARHKLEARAAGHKSEAQWIAFDHDHSLDLALGRAVARPSAPEPKKPDDGKPVYKGTKGKLITDFPTDY